MKMKNKIKNRDKSDAALPARTEALLRALLPFGVKWVTMDGDRNNGVQMWDNEPCWHDEFGYVCPHGRYLGSIFVKGLKGLELEPLAKINIEELAE